MFSSKQKEAKSSNVILLLIISSLAFTSCNNLNDDKLTEQTINITNDTAAIDYNPLRNAYYGDLHLHTSWSFDAFINGVKTTPDDAYMYAKGYEIDHISGKKIRISKPLDFLGVTDHAEYMGVFAMAEKDPNGEFAKIPLIEEFLNAAKEDINEIFTKVNRAMYEGRRIKGLFDDHVQKSVWSEMIKIANKHNEPGKFTTFAAYEWTSAVHIKPTTLMVNNLHRCIIYKEEASEIPFSSINSFIPTELWDWMDNERAKGIELLAIPHNGNISNAFMYGPLSLRGVALDEKYAKARRRNEPINEVSQAKGQSMAHPLLSPDDAFADFEMYETMFATGHQEGNSQISEPKGSYVREALKDGLKHKKEIGINPFKFGLIGSSDAHNGAGFYTNSNYHGKLGHTDATAKQRIESRSLFGSNADFSASGIAGVWAESNTRAAIFEALQRKETFATSGTRIALRFFAGYNVNDTLLNETNWVATAYDKMTCMGADLPATDKETPTFIIHAIKDADGATLDRAQIVKGWLDAEGNTHEKIYNIAWSGDREIDKRGKITPIKNAVNATDLSYDNATGSVEFKVMWKDPNFDKTEDAFYYVRVLEIPTAHWKSYDYIELNKPFPNGVPITTQERAWSTPIWYTAN